MANVDARQFWTWLGQRAIGATIVTVDGIDGPAGFLGLSATHVTAAPPVVLVCVQHTTTALKDIIQQRRFALNFLPRSSVDIVDLFSGKSGITGAARFDAASWTSLTTGCPIFREAVGALDCTLEEVIERENVALTLGRVVDGTANSAAEPLILFRGKPMHKLTT